MRLIDADKLKAHYAWWKDGKREMTMDEAKSDFDTIIDLQPTTEAEPKHGRWINAEYKPYEATCSVCGVRQRLERDNYCPNCGARMDGGEE